MGEDVENGRFSVQNRKNPHSDRPAGGPNGETVEDKPGSEVKVARDLNRMKGDPVSQLWV